MKLLAILFALALVAGVTAGLTMVVMVAYNTIAAAIGAPTIGFGMTFLLMLVADLIGFIVKR